MASIEIEFNTKKYSSVAVLDIPKAITKQDLKDLDEVVVSAKEAEIEFSYPLSKKTTATVTAAGEGITRRELAQAVHDNYQRIYKEEEDSMNAEPENIPGLLNRGTSDGKYGIWGHDLGDLFLEGAATQKKGDKVLVKLYMGS